MSVFDKRYVEVSIDNKIYYREVGVDNELGKPISNDVFYEILMGKIVNEIIEKEYVFQSKRIVAIIDSIPNHLDRQLMRDFYDYAMYGTRV
ncbi:MULTISPECIES: hypothetical protein [unclassified Lysinibacillus]|uniref:hypothetical protein n=1 Tax=unclassified Lysinibacillus TaxID=2636778 RepID=UPI00201B38A5|nr:MULTISPECIES: hypothetical protein [unclassified Lysinibacillus]